MSDPDPPADMSDAPDVALPPSLRLLKWLVILLMLTMIGGVITVVALLVTRMPDDFTASAPKIPAELTLPPGAKPAAVTFGTGWTAVVTTDDRILVFDSNGLLLQQVTIQPPADP